VIRKPAMRIKAYATLRDVLGATVIEVPIDEPTDIGRILHRIVEECPALGKKLWSDDGNLTGYVTILLNGRSIQYLSGLATPVRNDDTVALFPPVGGG
jgi:molybdopterin synthase sulfur carrier subunit